MNLLKCLSGIAIMFFLTTSVAADFAFTPKQAGDIVKAYDNNRPYPITDEMASSGGRQSAIDCRDNTGNSETCGAGLCSHVQATYIQLKKIAHCADPNLADVKLQTLCKGNLGIAQNIFKPLDAYCRCDGATTC
jgi:hypothetical protein